MRRKFIIILLCLFASGAYAASQKKIIQIQSWQTSGGANVYFVKSANLPMLDINVIFTAGSVYDYGKLGLASLVCNMLGEGAGTQNANQIAKTFDNIGAKFSANADRDKAAISLRSLTDPEYFNVALGEFVKVIAAASFPQDALLRVRNQTVAAIKVNQQRSGAVAKTAFFETVYGDQPYAHDPLGTTSSVKQISRAAVLTFYKRYYVAKNADIVLVGNLSRSQAKQVAEKISSALPPGKPAPRLRLATPLHHDIHRHIQFPSKQTAILIGQVGITRKNPSYFPLVVGNYAFGGLPLGSILFQEVRNQKGLAYYAGSTFQTLRYRGPFMIQLKTRASKTKEALSVVREALDNFVQHGPTQKQLNAAKQNLMGSFPLALSSNSNIAYIVSNIAFYKLPLNYLDTYKNKIRLVTTKEVKAAFEKTIHPKRLVVVTVGPVFFQK